MNNKHQELTEDRGVTLEDLKNALESVGWRISGTYPNSWIVDNEGERSKIRVLSDRLEIEQVFNVNFKGSVCFYFNSCTIEMLEDDTISLGSNNIFINFYGEALDKTPPNKV